MNYTFDHTGRIVPLREVKLTDTPVDASRISCPIARECWRRYMARKGDKR